MTTITITRALSKIKTLTAQIQTDLKEKTFITTAPNNLKNTQEYSKSVSELRGNGKSFKDKYATIINLKYLIAKSNLETTVYLQGSTVTITEALALKETFNLHEKLLQVLKRQQEQASHRILVNTDRINNSISDNTSNISCSSDIKNEDLELRLAANAKQLQDSMGIHLIHGSSDESNTSEEFIKGLAEYIDNFNSEIDYVLSEHNSTTYIELP